jgi:hypothetical protein
VPTSALSPFRALYAGGFFSAASPGASRLPWPSPNPAGLGSPLLPFRGKPCRRGRLHVMLRTGESLALHRGLRHDASPVGSRLAVAVSYRAAWTLPEPDSHRLVDVRLPENNPLPPLPSFRGLSLPGHSRIQGQTSSREWREWAHGNSRSAPF